MSIQKVSDVNSHGPTQVENAADALKSSKRLREVFEAIYTGKRQPKTVADIMGVTGIKYERQVLDLVRQLDTQGLIRREREEGQTFCYKVDHITLKRTAILKMARDSKKLKEFKIKNRPWASSGTGTISIRFPQKSAIKVKHITVDDIDSFSKVRGISPKTGQGLNMLERRFNNGIRKILGGSWEQKDWGGETDDLYSTHVKIGGKRVATAFAFKGRATRPPLVLRKMGKNGDQIQRLFQSPARLFIVQFQGPITESIIKEMKVHASLESHYRGGETVYFMVIDGQDSERLVEAYTKFF